MCRICDSTSVFMAYHLDLQACMQDHIAFVKSLSQLTNLQVLDMQIRRISDGFGPLPEALSKLSMLRRLSVHSAIADNTRQIYHLEWASLLEGLVHPESLEFLDLQVCS